jgi:tyrosinase
VQYCANCQTHLEVKAFVGLHAFQDESLESASYEVEIRTRDGVLSESPSQAPLATGLAAVAAGKRLFRIEVRP